MPNEVELIPGTSADLIKNDMLTVWDLLHGLLLPSGNDAAISLAYFFGKKLATIPKDASKIYLN